MLGHFDFNRKVCTCTMCSSLLILRTCSDFFQRFPATQVLFRLLTLLASLTEYLSLVSICIVCISFFLLLLAYLWCQ